VFATSSRDEKVRRRVKTKLKVKISNLTPKVLKSIDEGAIWSVRWSWDFLSEVW
jgi:hypothetical protein